LASGQQLGFGAALQVVERNAGRHGLDLQAVWGDIQHHQIGIDAALLAAAILQAGHGGVEFLIFVDHGNRSSNSVALHGFIFETTVDRINQGKVLV
jgi:hypothetical protein